MFPAVGLYWIGSFCMGANRVFPGWSQLVSLFPGIVGVYLRAAFYWAVLPRFGRDVWISFGTVFSHPTITIGDNVYLGIGCMVGDADLEQDVLIGSHVSIINGNHQHGIESLTLPVREQVGGFPRVKIGRDSWIGDRSLVMMNVGQHCVVGSGSVVTKDVSDFEIVVGNPARVIAHRQSERIIDQRERLP